MAAAAGGAMLWSEDMLRPPESRVDLVPELIVLVREPNRLWSQGGAAYPRSRAPHLPLEPPLFGLELDLIGKN